MQHSNQDKLKIRLQKKLSRKDTMKQIRTHSKGVDNTAYFLEKIENYTQKRLAEIEREIAIKVEEKKTTLAKQLKIEKDKISQELETTKQEIQKQKESNLELHHQKIMLQKKQDLYLRVREELLDHLKKSKKDSQKILMLLKKKIDEQSQNKIQRYLIPKGTTLSKLKRKIDAQLEHFGMIGVVDDNEEYEISVDELISKNESQIHEIIENHLKR